jgi:small subunit ribosomal protein S6
MRNYEVVIIVHPDLDETALNGIVEKIKAWIVDAGGAIDKVDMWGKRHMAYPIKKQRDGQYVLFKVQMAPTFGAELDRNLRFTEPVIRYLVTAVA